MQFCKICNNNKYHTIAISHENRDFIAGLGSKGDSYDKILTRIFSVIDVERIKEVPSNAS